MQKNAKNYGEYEDGNILSFSDFQRYLDYNEIKIKANETPYSVKDDLVPAMKSIATKSLLSVRKKLASGGGGDQRSCFELFGYDFMMDCEFNVWLIEVNTNPCLEDSSRFLARLLRRMLDDAFKITIDVCFPRKNGKRRHHHNNQIEKQMDKACKAAGKGLSEEALAEVRENIGEKEKQSLTIEGVLDSENLW